MSGGGRVRCRHAFEYLCVHANGDVVCSIIDGRGDFVLGNVFRQSLPDIIGSTRASELRRLVLSTSDSFCAAIGKRCPLKTLAVETGEPPPARIRFLAIEPTTACDLRCLACPIRGIAGDITWRDAYRDGGPSFLLWDGLRRTKQHAADATRRACPAIAVPTAARLGRFGTSLLRGRVPASRAGTLPIDVLRRVVTEAGPTVERVDLFSFGEPFLYPHLVEALRHIRHALPSAVIAASTGGMQLREAVEEVIVRETLLDWLVFSIDGCDAESYRRYRVRGTFEVAFANLVRFHGLAAGTGIHVVWQYVVFRWNDRDDQLRRAIDMAETRGIPIVFDFAHTWGRSRRTPDEVRYLTPYLKPFTALPGEARQGGW